MRLDDVRESENVEDRRGAGGFGGGFGGFGGGRIPLGSGGLGIGGVLVLLVMSYFLGINPLSLLSGGDIETDNPQAGSTSAPTGAPTSDPTAIFAAKILADTEDTWTSVFAQANRRYTKPRLVLYTDATQSGCGTGQSAMGPFYCPEDQKVYLDLSFFHELASRFGAPGDFAQVYVIAHEIGHHVQNLLGVLTPNQPSSRSQANAESVQHELQADCLAGVWGHSAASRNLLDTGDAEEGLAAASAIGDDCLQRATQGRVVPDSFTHGLSAQRVAALKRGLDSGDITACGLGR